MDLPKYGKKLEHVLAIDPAHEVWWSPRGAKGFVEMLPETRAQVAERAFTEIEFLGVSKSISELGTLPCDVVLATFLVLRCPPAAPFHRGDLIAQKLIETCKVAVAVEAR